MPVGGPAADRAGIYKGGIRPRDPVSMHCAVYRRLRKDVAYYIDLFSPETYGAFTRSKRDVSGFRLRHKRAADQIKPGDILVCYLTRLSRWFGLLEVVDGPFVNDTPVFVPEYDPFVVR